MTHIEGVLKSFKVDDVGETLICEMKGYDNQIYEFGISLQQLLERTIKNEKVGIVLYEGETADFVSIRGVAKSLDLTAKYGGNF